MKQTFNARYQKDRLVLFTENKLLRKIVRKLQEIYDANLYDENLFLHREINKKNDMFVVVFEYNNEYSFSECVLNLEQKILEFRFEYEYLLRERNEIKSKWTSEVSNATMEIHNSISEDLELEEAIVIIDQRLKDVKASIDNKYKKQIELLNIEYNEIKKEYSFLSK